MIGAGAAALLPVLTTPGAARAQEPAGGGRRPPALGAWTALARNEPLRTRFGHTHDRDLYAMGLRAAWALTHGAAVRLEYTVDFLPAVLSTEMPTYAVTPRPTGACRSGEPCSAPLRSREALLAERSVYGVGVLPAGLQLRVPVGSRLSLLARGAAGAVWFDRRVPDPREKRLNFWGDLGAGAELAVASALSLGAGFRLNHISNANTGPVNPGMNSRMLELGVSWRR
ncbi:MAG: acyloxyacyl hydrolase [Gemmatimonadaceae bacterium]